MTRTKPKPARKLDGPPCPDAEHVRRLAALLAGRREPAVATPDGPGRLWQVFAGRVGVVLDARPDVVVFYWPEEVNDETP